MNYHNILHDDMRNGDGLRVVLFVAGCEHHCPGCHNPITHDINGGIEFSQDEVDEIVHELGKDYISGITISGGDPLHPENRYEITRLCSYLKWCAPDKTIWMYTGYLYEDVKRLIVMRYIDVLIDGPFIQELADVNYKWAGSRNQRVIDVKKSRPSGKIILHE